MSKFVDYKKRDCGLPQGCKDLFDVLKAGGLEEAKKSELVDYEKRDASLPEGMKDLIEVLNMEGGGGFYEALKQAYKSGGIEAAKQVVRNYVAGKHKGLPEAPRRIDTNKTGLLGDMKEQIQAVYDSKAQWCDLWINIVPREKGSGGATVEKHISAMVGKWPQRAIGVQVAVSEDSDEEKALIDFLKSRGLTVPGSLLHHSPPGIGEVSSLCELSPLPEAAGDLAQLLCDLFRHVGVAEEDAISYRLSERFPPEKS